MAMDMAGLRAPDISLASPAQTRDKGGRKLSTWLLSFREGRREIRGGQERVKDVEREVELMTCVCLSELLSGNAGINSVSFIHSAS